MDLKCAVIENGVVVNMILADPTVFSIPGYTLIPMASNTDVDIGWLWNGTEFTKTPEMLAADLAELQALQDQAWGTV